MRSSALSRRSLFSRVVLVSILLPFGLGCSGPVGSNLGVDSWAYSEMERLRAAGLIRSGSLTTRPIGRIEAARLVTEAGALAGEEGDHEALCALDRLERHFAMEIDDTAFGGRLDYWQPIDEVRLEYAFFDGSTDAYNEGGRDYHLGSNLRFGISSRFAAGPLSGYALWEARWLEADAASPQVAAGRLQEGYVRLSGGGWFAEYGRESLWWGPGHHGALLLSNNARPFDLVRLGSDEPFLLPGFLSHLGPARVTLFWTELEEKRTVPGAQLAGLRVSIMPKPWIELGISRTAMFGGEGRPVTWQTIWDILTARNENTPGGPGNQLASLDWRLTVEWPRQPFEFYGEYGGEDEAGAFFAKVAIVAGLYFPRLGSRRDLDFRVEYADTYFGGHKGVDRVWYQHSIYQTGYTYEGRVIGHHAGTDARDLYYELGWQPKAGMRVWVAFDFEDRELSYPAPEERAEYSLGLEWGGRAGRTFGASYTHEEIDNFNFVAGSRRKGDRLSLKVAWKL